MLPVSSKALESHLESIVGERNPYHSPEKLIRVENYIEKTLTSFGYQPVKEEVVMDGVKGFNIHAAVNGQADCKADGDLWLMGAHYDSVPDSPGADDNASAVAALLEIAHCLKETSPAINLQLSAFTFEEYGFVGSEVTAEHFYANKKNIRGMVSLEMLGYTDKRPGAQKYPPGVDPAQYPDTGDFIAVVGNEASIELTRKVVSGMKQAAPELGVEMLVVPGKGEMLPDVRRSDHVPFWDRDLPAVMITDTANFRNPNYHLPSDTLETLDIEFLRQVTQALAGWLINAHPIN